uniref:Uncharacterized protein n=1 Tax=uncultured marine virus TaxID=186617 RepID=A0A0F7L3Z8_9VIRU|nr:hypothetical protein [uncultured marine virus]
MLLFCNTHTNPSLIKICIRFTAVWMSVYGEQSSSDISRFLSNSTFSYLYSSISEVKNNSNSNSPPAYPPSNTKMFPRFSLNFILRPPVCLRMAHLINQSLDHTQDKIHHYS